MKHSALLALICALLLLLASAGACNYMKPVMYVDIANRSGHTLQNIEVKHPTRGGTGQFGLPNLRTDQVHRHMIPVGTPCRFAVEFDDEAGKHYAHDFALGDKCPTEVLFEIGGGMSVSQQTATP
jgi:hypothetical protein